MSATPPEYVHDEAAQIAEDRQRLSKACVDIPEMEAELDRLIRNLDGARRLRDALTESLPLRMRALELLCADKGWALPVGPPPVKPTPIADGITRETTGTIGFEALRVAIPTPGQGDGVECGQPGCGMELMHENGLWIHCSTGQQMCELPVPGLQQGVDGDPTKQTVLPPHIAAEVRNDG
jgi:hypothetical protein